MSHATSFIGGAQRAAVSHHDKVRANVMRIRRRQTERVSPPSTRMFWPVM